MLCGPTEETGGYPHVVDVRENGLQPRHAAKAQARIAVGWFQERTNRANEITAITKGAST
jgi:hypothetical protein